MQLCLGPWLPCKMLSSSKCHQGLSVAIPSRSFLQHGNSNHPAVEAGALIDDDLECPLPPMFVHLWHWSHPHLGDTLMLPLIWSRRVVAVPSSTASPSMWSNRSLLSKQHASGRPRGYLCCCNILIHTDHADEKVLGHELYNVSSANSWAVLLCRRWCC